MLCFHQGRPLDRGRLGVFPGAFNPLTTAHVSLARAARAQHGLDQIMYVLPTEFPHKPYSEARFESRLGMLRSAFEGETGSAICSSDKGLFIDIFREVRRACGSGVDVHFLCGRDAAERIVNWDYGSGVPFESQIENYQMLVASRGGDYRAPTQYRTRIHPIELEAEYDAVSSTGVRAAVASGREWRHMVPGPVAKWVLREGLYRGGDGR